ncbi:MAG: hypothetical protein U1E45_22620 [Geminicoccaceae bacterium]
MASEHPAKDRREGPGVATLPIVASAVGYLAFVAVMLFVLQTVFGNRLEKTFVWPPQVLPEPQLQRDPVAERRRVQAEQAARLTGYAWVDRSKGLVQVPIERAMELVVARGAAAYDPVLSAEAPFRPGDVAQGSAPP